MYLELEQWNSSSTSGVYMENSLMHFHSLGEGAYGIIIFQPNGEMYLEEIPLYGGEPHVYGNVSSIQKAFEIFKEWT